MTLRWSVEASHDLEGLFDFVAEEGNFDSAAGVLEAILSAAERLLLFPHLGHVGRDPETRELILTPYIIVYRVIDTVINIESVIHGVRRF